MSWKNLNQQSLANGWLVEHEALQELDELNRLIDWDSVQSSLSGIHNKERGGKAWPPLLMFKILLLQVWYNLSDPRMEKQLVRDLLFRRFVGLDVALSVPDHSSIWRFRQILQEHELLDELLDKINEKLSNCGLCIREGTVSIVDASVIEAHNCRPKQGKEGHNTQDPEAGCSVKVAADGKKKSIYGFKAHISADEDGFIKATEMTAGNVHDSQVFERLLDGDESAVYADSAYASCAHDKWLTERGIENRIIHRAYRNKPLTKEQKIANRLNSATRSTVERVFGILKLHYGMGKARYRGLMRNHVRFVIMCIGYNLKRALSIQRESCA